MGGVSDSSARALPGLRLLVLLAGLRCGGFRPLAARTMERRPCSRPSGRLLGRFLAGSSVCARVEAPAFRRSALAPLRAASGGTHLRGLPARRLEPLERMPGERRQRERGQRQESDQHRAGDADLAGDGLREEARDQPDQPPPGSANRRRCRGRRRDWDSTPARYGSSTLRPTISNADRFMSSVPRRSKPASASPMPSSGIPSAPAPSSATARARVPRSAGEGNGQERQSDEQAGDEGGDRAQKGPLKGREPLRLIPATAASVTRRS